MSIVSLGANTSLGFASPSQTSIVSYIINKEFVPELYQEKNQTTFLEFNSKKQNEYTLFSGNAYGNVDLYQKKLETSFIYFNSKKQNEYTLFSGNAYGTSDIYQEKNQDVILQYKIQSDLRTHILLKYATAFGLSASVFPTSLSLSGLSSDTTIKQATRGGVTAESRIFPSAVTRYQINTYFGFSSDFYQRKLESLYIDFDARKNGYNNLFGNNIFNVDFYQRKLESLYIDFDARKNGYNLLFGNNIFNVDFYQRKLESLYIDFDARKNGYNNLFGNNTFNVDFYQRKLEVPIERYVLSTVNTLNQQQLFYSTSLGGIFSPTKNISQTTSGKSSVNGKHIDPLTVGGLTPKLSSQFMQHMSVSKFVLGQAYVITKMIPNPGTDFSLYSPFVRFQVKFQRFVEVDIKFFFAVKFVDGRNKLLNTIRYLNFWT